MSEFTPASELEGQAPPPPAQESSATPAEATEAAPVEAPPVGEAEGAAQTPAPDATDEPSTDASEAEDTPSVRAQARKVFMEVEKMGGRPAFEAAQTIFNAFFRKTPQEAIGELSQYGARFYPLRDQLITDTVRAFPDEVADMLRELHPDLEIQVAKKGAKAPPAQPQADSFDPKTWAQEVLDDPNALETERQAARHLLTLQEQQAETQKKLPQLEERLNRFDQMSVAQKEQAVAVEQGRYAEELLSVVDKTWKDSGLEGSGISLDRFRQLVVAEHGSDPEKNARLQEAMDAIAKGDMKTAHLLKESIMRDGEQIAFQYAKSFSPAYAQTLASRARQVTQERPKVIPPGQAPGASVTTAPPFDEAEYAGALKDIKARVD